jgi:iron-sulfur cluster repair protein YtfE (RIC family)
MPKLTECLEVDHRRLDRVLVETKSLAASGRFPNAAALFATFARGLSRHIDAEENILFPALDESAPHAAGPMHVMRLEHARLKELLEQIGAALERGDAAWQRDVRELEGILAEHNLKEERILYPLSDDATSRRPDFSELLDALQVAIR